MKEWEKNFLATHRVARLASVDSRGQPHALPIVYAFDGEQIYTPIDEKPKRAGVYQLQRVRNIQAEPRVAVIVDDYTEDWDQLAWVQVRGQAELLTAGETYEKGLRLLNEKYPQYRSMALSGRPLIVITPERVSSWKAS
jgi:PPOX class probable F420-dependent enzyme